MTAVGVTGTAAYKSGALAQFEVTLANNGPGDAPGITVVVAMPGSFHYKSTDSIVDSGSARTQPLDARVGTSDPQWGFWDIAAPTAAGQQSIVSITFTASVQGAPGSYNLDAHAQGDNTAGLVLAKPLLVQVVPAPNLQVTATVDSTAVRPGAMDTYHVTIANTGSDSANNVALLATLPPVMAFQTSVTPFAGNASRSNPVDPVPGSLEVFYSGFTIPAASSAGPGFVAIVFKAQVVQQAEAGTFALNLLVTDNAGDSIELNNVAPVMVQGTPSPSF